MVATSTRNRVSEGIDGKDAVGLYLEGIAKTPLLTAAEEVELAKTNEAGLYAEKILSGEVTSAERRSNVCSNSSTVHPPRDPPSTPVPELVENRKDTDGHRP